MSLNGTAIDSDIYSKPADLGFNLVLAVSLV